LVEKNIKQTILELMEASIIIPTKNRETILLNSLRYAIKAIATINVEIIIVNDGDNDINLPEEWKSKIRIIKNPKSGVASARNLGAANAISEVLIFMDDDMLINESAVKKVIEYIYQNTTSTININWIYTPELLIQLKQTKFGRYLDNHGFTSLKGWNKDQPWNNNELFENIGVTSQFLGINKAIFNSINGYDETFPHAGYEDYDFAERMHKKGIKFYVWPKDIIYHNETDRHELSKWLERKRRGGETRKHAVLRGNKELVLQYNGVKKIILRFLTATKKMWIRFLSVLPNSKWLDGFYGKMVNILLATSIFEGYTKTKD
jgi:glycosyltransferase involved in cell wall biosynthesis